MADSRTQVWSCGGGVNSIAIGALIIQGVLPKPDIALIVDTERENTSTWNYLGEILQPELDRIGLEIHRVRKSDFATVDLFSHQNNVLMPGFTTLQGKGKLSNWCSHEWKKRVAMRWLRTQGVEECDSWLGICIDEMRRVRVSDVRWLTHKYPLIDLRFRRDDCHRIIAGMGWPRAVGSSCVMCPNKSDFEWLEMKNSRPLDFRLAVKTEAEVRESDPHFYCHISCVPLDEVIFADSLPGFDNACSSGYCYV